MPEKGLLEFGKAVMDSIGAIPLYARIDAVGKSDGNFALMELELIEPALYFRYDENAPRMFAACLDSRK
ncbi:MAG: hypothetical protein OEM82_02845 [Acidobacteriota bacterium]|nr:hypothetical protein [Acidobacteriota bacterium]